MHIANRTPPQRQALGYLHAQAGKHIPTGMQFSPSLGVHLALLQRTPVQPDSVRKCAPRHVAGMDSAGMRKILLLAFEPRTHPRALVAARFQKRGPRWPLLDQSLGRNSRHKFNHMRTLGGTMLTRAPSKRTMNIHFEVL